MSVPLSLLLSRIDTGGIDPVTGALLGAAGGMARGGGLMGGIGGALGGLERAQASNIAATQAELLKANAPLALRLQELGLLEAEGREENRQRKVAEMKARDEALRNRILGDAGVPGTAELIQTSAEQLAADPAAAPATPLFDIPTGEQDPLDAAISRLPQGAAPAGGQDRLGEALFELPPHLGGPVGGAGNAAPARGSLQQGTPERTPGVLAVPPGGFELKTERVGNEVKRRFNVDALLSGDTAEIKRHLRYVEGTLDPEVAQQRGFNSEYDVTFGYGVHDPKGHNHSTNPISGMTMPELRAFQRGMIERQKAEGTAKYGATKDQPTSAVGMPQVTYTTLFGRLDGDGKGGLYKKLGLTEDTVFDPGVQERIADELLESRVLGPWRRGEMSEKEALAALKGVWDGANVTAEDLARLSDERGVASPPVPGRAAVPTEPSALVPRPQDRPDPLNIRQLPVEQQAQAVLRARQAYRSASAGYIDALGMFGEGAVVGMQRGSGVLFDNDGLERELGYMLAYGNSNEQVAAMSGLRQLQERRDLLSAQGENRLLEAAKASALVEQGDVALARDQYFETYKAELKRQQAEDQYVLDRSRQLELAGVNAENRAILERDKVAVQERMARRAELEKKLAARPTIEADIHALRDRAVKAHRLLELFKNNKDSTGRFVGRLPVVGPNSEARQLIQALTLEMNGYLARELMGSQFTAKEAFLALFEIGPSSMQKGEVNVELMAPVLEKLIRGIAEAEGAYEGTFGEVLPVDPRSAYARLAARNGAQEDARAIFSGKAGSLEDVSGAAPRHVVPPSTRAAQYEAGRRAEAEAGLPPIPRFRGR